MKTICDGEEHPVTVQVAADTLGPTIAPRNNVIMQEVVETGLSIMRKSGSKRASQFMAAAGVPKNVALRVLARPNDRRKTSK